MAQLVSPRVRTVTALEVHTDRVSEGERQAWLPDPGFCLFSRSLSPSSCAITRFVGGASSTVPICSGVGSALTAVGFIRPAGAFSPATG